MNAQYQRSLPALNDDNRFFWTSGADGILRILRCTDCGHWQHPPQPCCSVCLSPNVSPTPVSGKGTVWSYTINMRAWFPGMEEPYAIAIVALDDAKGVRMTAKLVNVDPNTVYIGMPLQVAFEKDEDVWLPFFTAAKG